MSNHIGYLMESPKVTVIFCPKPKVGYNLSRLFVIYNLTSRRVCVFYNRRIERINDSPKITTIFLCPWIVIALPKVGIPVVRISRRVNLPFHFGKCGRNKHRCISSQMCRILESVTIRIICIGKIPSYRLQFLPCPRPNRISIYEQFFG